MTGGMLVVRGDARRLPIADASIDLIVTSPPFWNLRDYGTAGQIGSETSRDEFLEQLWEVTAECRRVMKPTASLFVELGDSYTDKSLNLAPQRYAIGCTDKLGLILRAEIIWDRPNGLPESVTDRVRVSHSRWWHLVRQPRYYAALDEIRTPHSENTHARRRDGQLTPKQRAWVTSQPINNGQEGLGRSLDANHPLGALPGSVWSIPSEPLRLPPWIDTQHYAAFPTRWPEQLIKAFSPPGICVRCKVGRFPIVHRDRIPRRPSQHKPTHAPPGQAMHGANGGLDFEPLATIVGYGCGCTPHTDHPATGESSGEGYNRSDRALIDGGYPPNFGAGSGTHDNLSGRPRVGPWREYHLDGWTPPPTTPPVILDPFGGTGTVAHVAHALGRHAITIDLSDAYCRLASDTTLAQQRAAKVHGRVHLERQGTLFDAEATGPSPFSVLNLFPDRSRGRGEP